MARKNARGSKQKHILDSFFRRVSRLLISTWTFSSQCYGVLRVALVYYLKLLLDALFVVEVLQAKHATSIQLSKNVKKMSKKSRLSRLLTFNRAESFTVLEHY
jgi:hypothetical protein